MKESKAEQIYIVPFGDVITRFVVNVGTGRLSLFSHKVSATQPRRR